MDNFFNDIDFSTDKQAEEFFTDLVDRALKGKQSDFEFIRSWQERQAVKRIDLELTQLLRFLLISATQPTKRMSNRFEPDRRI